MQPLILVFHLIDEIQWIVLTEKKNKLVMKKLDKRQNAKEQI